MGGAGCGELGGEGGGGVMARGGFTRTGGERREGMQTPGRRQGAVVVGSPHPRPSCVDVPSGATSVISTTKSVSVAMAAAQKFRDHQPVASVGTLSASLLHVRP